MARGKILIYTTAYLPLIGGAEVAVLEITNRLSDWEFEIITARINRQLPKEERVGNILVRRIGFGLSLDKFILAILGGRIGANYHRQNNYSLIWGIMASFGGLAAADCRRRTNLPFLLTLQEGDNLEIVDHKMSYWLTGFNRIFKTADKIQAISNFLADWAKTKTIDKDIVVIPNGVSIEKFNQVKPEKIFTAGLTIITTSRLVFKNGVDTLIEAIASVPAVNLLIVGDGPDRKKLEKSISQKNLNDRTIILGQVSPDRIPGLLKGADIFCRPSRTEGLGNSFLEAMACGLPTVGTPVGGIVDFLKDGQTGFLVPPDDPIALARKIKYLIDKSKTDEIKEIADRGRQLINEKYGWQLIASRMGEIFSSLV